MRVIQSRVSVPEKWIARCTFCSLRYLTQHFARSIMIHAPRYLTQKNDASQCAAPAAPLILVGDKFWSTTVTPELKCVSKPDPAQNKNVWTADGKDRIETNQDAFCVAEGNNSDCQNEKCVSSFLVLSQALVGGE